MPKVFLSPSTQEWNPYIDGGNEEQYMNLIADRMEPYLRSSVRARGLESDTSLCAAGTGLCPQTIR